MREQINFVFGAINDSLKSMSLKSMTKEQIASLLVGNIMGLSPEIITTASQIFCNDVLVNQSVNDLRNDLQLQDEKPGLAILSSESIFSEPKTKESILLFEYPVSNQVVFMDALSKVDVETLKTLKGVSDRWLNIAREALWQKLSITRDNEGVVKAMNIEPFLKADGPGVAHLKEAIDMFRQLMHMHAESFVVDMPKVYLLLAPNDGETDVLQPVRNCIMLAQAPPAPAAVEADPNPPGNLLLAVHNLLLAVHAQIDDVNAVPEAAFQNNAVLPVIEVPAGFTSIRSAAFSNCSSLASVKLPASLTNIDASAFQGCTSLVSVELPTDLKSIGEFAFKNCSNLASVELPTGLKSIGEYAF